MNIRNPRSSSFGRPGAVLLGLLLVCSTGLFAQSDKEKDKHSSQRQSSGSSHSQRESAPPQGRSHQESAPRPAPQVTTPPPQQHQGSGQITGRQQSSGQPGGQPAPTPNSSPAPNASSGSRQGGQQFGGREGRTNRDQGSAPASGRSGTVTGQPAQPNSQVGAQGAGQGSRPNGGQGTRSNGGQVFGGGQPQGGNPGGQGNRSNGGQVFGGGQPQGSNPAGQGSRTNSGQQFGGASRPTPAGGNFGGSRYGSNNVVHTRNGGDVIRSSSGGIREVRTPGGAVIHHAPDVGRRIEVARPGGRVVVASEHGRSGYVQRPLVIRNTTYVQRTYIYGGRSYARVYRPYVFGGFTFHVYTPAYYYHPAFYSYVYSPWARPVYYNWGWNSSPWYGYYGGWFTPYPVYASPALWLTDFLISRTLEDAYQARVDAAASMQAQNYGSTPLTPDVKQAISDEVRRQLDEEREQQGNPNQSGAPPLFSSNGPQVFVVSTPLTVGSQAGDCVITEGDVLQMNGPPPPNSGYGQVTVLASKGRDCRKGSVVEVALNDLQEMQNQMRATIDQGLGDLRSKQGQGGLPSLPPAAAAPPDNAFGTALQPDSNAGSELASAAQEAERDEQDVVGQSADAGGSPNTISLGMSIGEVERTLGRPRNIANLGSKRIYVYQDMKVTFIDGRVSDVQ